MLRMSRSTVLGGTVAGAAVLLGLALLGAGSGQPWHVQLPTLPDLGDPNAAMPTMPTPAMPSGLSLDDAAAAPSRFHLGAWVAWVAAALVAALLVFLLIRWLSKRALPDGEVPADRDVPDGLADTGDEVRRAVVDAVDAALDRLGASGPPRDAVVAAWMELEAVAERVGVERAPAQTPTEFTAGLLAATAAPADAVTQLRGRYHAARFSDHAVTSDDVAQARDALRRIAAALSRTDPAGVV